MSDYIKTANEFKEITNLQAVKEHALAHYGQKSWSYVVEAWSDEEIEWEIKKARNAEDAITIMGNWVDLHFSFAEDIRNS